MSSRGVELELFVARTVVVVRLVHGIPLLSRLIFTVSLFKHFLAMGHKLGIGTFSTLDTFGSAVGNNLRIGLPGNLQEVQLAYNAYISRFGSSSKMCLVVGRISHLKSGKWLT